MNNLINNNKKKLYRVHIEILIGDFEIIKSMFVSPSIELILHYCYENES